VMRVCLYASTQSDRFAGTAAQTPARAEWSRRT
jgi:hypothetical protein